MFGELVALCKGNDKFKRWHANPKLFELLTEIALYGCESGENGDTLSDRIVNYLSENLSKPFSAKALEREFFLSYKRMAAIFKEQTGTTMQRFSTEAKMNEACRLLRTTLMPVNEIAFAVGYGDPLYFSKRFHSFIGMAPVSYRALPPVY